MNPNEMEGNNGGGHHPHGHHPPPDHYYDPQGQPYPNYGSYPNYPYAYYHHDGGPPPPHPHQYHEGQFYPPPHPYYDPYGMDPPPHNIKAESDQYYQGPPPHHEYRMDDGHGRQVQMEEVSPEEKIVEPVAEQAVEEQKVEAQPEQAKEMQVEHEEEAAHDVPAQESAPKEDVAVQQQQEERAIQVDNQIVETRDEILDLSEGKAFPFEDILRELQGFKSQHGHANIPVNHPAFTKIMDFLVQNDIEKEADKQWNRQFNIIKEYKDKYGDCGIPYNDPNIGEWMALHRQLKADGASDPLTASRLAKLDAIGFEWDLTVWDRRLQELAEYTKQHNHTDVPIAHPGGLGVWVVNQKFNLNDMPKERIAALDALNFIWNHNRKRRNNKMWDQRYAELQEYVEKHGTANVPTTAGHSKLSKWVGKQREEYKKFNNKQSSQLDRVRIEQLEKVGFQWSIQQWKNVPWEERFEALKKFKEEHGHMKIPRSHPYFGNWPNWQRTQYKLYISGKESKITKDKVDKLIAIGFFKAPPGKQVAL